MNTKTLLAFLLLSVCTLTKPKAQISFNLNIGVQPVWGPVGYDRVDNYYLPDIETYYNVQNRQYTYLVNGNWVTTNSLPPNHLDYNLYSGHKVVINGSRPYLHHNVYRVRYANFRGRHDQVVIRDSKDSRYFENKDHPQHGKWKENGHDNRDEEHGNKDKEHDNGDNDHGDNRGGNGGNRGGHEGDRHER